MGLFDRFRAQPELNVKARSPRTIEVKSALGTSTALGDFLMHGTENASTPANAINLYEQSSAVSNPVHMIADQFQLFEPVLQESGSNDIIEEHPLLDLLRKPSPDFTQELFLHKLAVDYLVTGEATIVASGNLRAEPVEIQPLSPQDITAVEGNGGYVATWDVTGSCMTGSYKADIVDRTRRFYRDSMSELRVIKRVSTKDGSLIRGMSPLVNAAQDARQNIAGGKYNLSLLNDGGRVSMVFHFEEDMDEDTWEETKAQVRGTYGGPDGEKIGVTQGGKMSIQQMGHSARDMDFEKLQQMTKFSIALAYHIPLPLLSTDAMTFNNMGEAKLMLFDDAVIPLSRKILGDLGYWLLPRFGEDPRRLRLTFDQESVQPLIDRRNDRIKARREIGVESTNELRREIPNRPDIEGGDHVLVPGTMIPLQTLDLEAEPFDPNEPAGPRIEEVDVDGEE